MLNTINPGKQRKAVYTASIHQRRKLMSAHVDAPIREKVGGRSVVLRVGDTVKIQRGDYKGKTGNVTQLDVKRQKVFVQGLMRKKSDGKEAFLAFPPSSLLITSVDSKDKRRFSIAQKSAEKPIKTSARPLNTHSKTGEGKKE